MHSSFNFTNSCIGSPTMAITIFTEFFVPSLCTQHATLWGLYIVGSVSLHPLAVYAPTMAVHDRGCQFLQGGPSFSNPKRRGKGGQQGWKWVYPLPTRLYMKLPTEVCTNSVPSAFPRWRGRKMTLIVACEWGNATFVEWMVCISLQTTHSLSLTQPTHTKEIAHTF